MSTNESVTLHPVFDPMSLYRQGTELSIWSDGGETSIRRFFFGVERLRKRAAMKSGTSEPVPGSIHEKTQGPAGSSQFTTDPRTTLRGDTSLAADSSRPGMPSIVVLNYSESDEEAEYIPYKKQEKGEPFNGYNTTWLDQTSSGEGVAKTNAKLPATTNAFWVQLTTDIEEVQAVAFIITEHLLDAAETIFGDQPKTTDLDQRIQNLFNARVLEPVHVERTEEDMMPVEGDARRGESPYSKAWRTAGKLVALLSLAPAMPLKKGKIDGTSAYTKKVDLDGNFHFPSTPWHVVVLFGPLLNGKGSFPEQSPSAD